jgi:RNA polymerase primary sigma factor
MRQLKITKRVTNRETASLDKYKKLEKLTLLPLTKSRISTKIKAGDQALEKLTKSKFTFRCFGSKTIPKSRFNTS